MMSVKLKVVISMDLRLIYAILNVSVKLKNLSLVNLMEKIPVSSPMNPLSVSIQSPMPQDKFLKPQNILVVNVGKILMYRLHCVSAINTCKTSNRFATSL